MSAVIWKGSIKSLVTLALELDEMHQPQRFLPLCVFTNYLINQKSLHKVMQVGIFNALFQWRIHTHIDTHI